MRGRNQPDPRHEGSNADIIRLEGVERRFRVGREQPVVALAGVSLAMPQGATVALAGRSGSGKSTLLHVLGGLESVDAGSVVVDGRDLVRVSRRELAEHRRRVGFVFQRFNLLPALTVLDNVLVPVLPSGVKPEHERRARDLLTRVGLEGRERALPSRLSGGEQQRVAIARALVNQPALVLADEPTGNLDSRTGDEVLELLLGVRDQERIAVVVATHDPRVAARCDRVIRLLDGRVVDDVEVGGGADLQALFGAAAPSSGAG
jgi:putative ABC transport system ATP-binding protein